MTITRDIIRVFYHTIMAVCSTVYMHLYWGSQKTESIILGVATRGSWRPYILPVLILTTMKVN